jgi:hypothetical protein
MTREQQIQDSLRLLAPTPERRDECEREIKRALDIIKLESTTGVIGSKQHKLAIRDFEKALRRVKTARRNLIGPERGWTEEGDDEDLLPLGLDQWIAYCEEERARPRPQSFRRAGNPKYQAVYWAQILLRNFGHQAGKTRGGEWAQLAAILYGKPDADLYSILLRFRPFIRPSLHRRPKTGSE